MNQIESYLFETNALRICPESKPFWLTSGKISPYFINTHFLYGSEQEASGFLTFIDENKEKRETLPQKIFEKVLNQYQTNEIYHHVIEDLVCFIQKNIPLSQIDAISGGERRDWFFSNLLAYLLEKPHISIFKGQDCYLSDASFTSSKPINSFKQAKILHIADLITIASSYIRDWIPAVDHLQANMKWSVAVVDRMQGGTEQIEKNHIASFSMIRIDKSLFQDALEKKVITPAQFNLVTKFLENPDRTMREFLITHPEFLENSLHADEKTVKRAKLCLDQNFYQL